MGLFNTPLEMEGFSSIGKPLIIIGLILVAIGVLFMLGWKIHWVGSLPGDIYIRRENFTFYFPLATSIVVSIIFSLILYLFFRR